MAAVFTGNGLGLFGADWGSLPGGDARMGQGPDRQSINLATGNLVLQAQDEQLLFRGLSIGQVRTYNSLGLSGQVGSDGWFTGFERHVELLSGALNQTGSIMRRHVGDGSVQDFEYVAPNLYRATSGEGAHDTLAWDENTRTWSYVEGSSRREERYADHADANLDGRLTHIRDFRSDAAAPTTWEVVYDLDDRIGEVRAVDGTSSGDALVFGYDAAGRVASISTREGGVVRGQVDYGYDSIGRLESVLVDLTPEDGVGDDDSWDATSAYANDGYLFRTSYTYTDATSLRIAQVRQSDGTLVSYTYDAQGRIATMTRGDVNADDSDGVGQTLHFAYDTANLTTHVSDASGRAWSYTYDAQGRLTQTQSPASDGLRSVTAYSYDGDGNLTRVATSRGGVALTRVDYQYDTQGNVVWEWHAEDPSQRASARAIQRTYTATNQIASETVFANADADGSGSLDAPTGGETTRYVYDSQDRLRFAINALGEVREFEYAGSGNGVGQLAYARQYLAAGYSGGFTLAEMEAWATTAQRAGSSLTETTYDIQGRPAQTRAFASVDGAGNGVEDDTMSVTQYVYDAQGLLRQQIARRSSTAAANDGRDTAQITRYVYDGMGRLLSEVTSEQLDGGSERVLRTTSMTYMDSQFIVQTMLLESKLVRTQVHNAAGQVVTTSDWPIQGGATLTTRNYYDANGQLRASQDAGGARTYFFYDAQGQLEGQVGPTGTVIRYVRDGLGHVVGTKTYATAVNTSSWLSGGTVVPTSLAAVLPAGHADDRTTLTTYDADGRVVTQIDGEGGITTYLYDGAGRLVRATATDAAGTAATARVTRYFYDAAGRQVAQLDAEGYLVEYEYDRAGRRVRTTAYATATAVADRAYGALSALRRPPTDADQITRTFYDGRGNVVAELDAEGYLTEYVVDDARNARAVLAYAKRLAGLQGNESLATLSAQAKTGALRETRRSFDAFGNVLVEVNPEGTVTRYTYDADGRLLKTEAAAGTSDARVASRRYDAFGNLTGELGDEGSSKLTALMSAAEIDAVYAQYGVRHAYDALGRRIESIDAGGNKTWYFYDGAGRLTQTVRGVANSQGVANAEGEVTETRYTAFGDVRETITYTGRITIGTPGSRASVASAVSTLQYVASADSRQQFSYDHRGLLASSVDAEGFLTSYGYDAFGNQIRQRVQIDATRTLQVDMAYDRRGLLRSRLADAGGLGQSATWSYDAFGRVDTATDARGTVSTFGYDRLGRQVTQSRTISGRLEQQSSAYDAYGRVLTQTDSLGRVTSYAYNDATRSVTVTTPENVRITTQHDAHGDTVRVTDAFGQSMRYEYDRDGRLLRTIAADGATSEQQYDARGLLIASIDASGRRVAYTYDAAGRVLSRIEDPSGLALTTSYAYDGQGRQVRVTDATGTVTTLAYDRAGQLVARTVDEGGLSLKTTYAWDGRGSQLSVTEAAGTAAARTTVYAYDMLGRRISETVDPGAGRLNLATSYAYDGNDNLVSRTDASGRTIRYTYDEANRRIFTVDGAGGVVQSWYDANGRVVATRAYAQAIDLAGLPAVVTTAAVQARLSVNDARDVQNYTVYDGDGRVRLRVDGVGAVIETRYDAAGRAVQTRAYANALALPSYRAALQAGDATSANLLAGIVPDATRDRIDSSVLDVNGRVRFTIAGDGSVREWRYDAAGRVSQAWAYAYTLPLSQADRTAIADGNLAAADVAARVASQQAQARAEYRVYDAAGRERFVVVRSGATMGVATENRFDAGGRVIAQVAYGTEVAFDPADAEAELALSLQSAAQRVTRFVYDRAGRQRFSIDASGAVTETRYDAAGRVTDTLAYANAAPVDATGEASLASWAQTQPATQVRRTHQEYDAAGRLRVRTDALNQAEYFGYDGAGMLTTHTDRNGAVWTYAYDGAGRRIAEFSPQVAVAIVDPSGSVAEATRSIVTRIGYDALGNVTSRTEDADASVQAGAYSRTTIYEYDNRGNQIRTRFPDAYYIDAANQLVATGQTPTIDVVYDVLGRAVVQKDVQGRYSYRTYDALGRLAYETDAEGYVTSYAYGAFGDQTRLTRHAARINTAALTGWSAGQALGLLQMATAGVVASGANDRTLSTTYDLRGQKSAVVQSQVAYYTSAGALANGSPTTRFQYDAYGQLVLESVLLEGEDGQANARWANTWHYYDVLGRDVLTVDAEGYATSTSYNATGEVVETIEHARALDTAGLTTTAKPGAPAPGDAVTGYDRVMRWTYDALGRKAGETAVRRYQRTDGSAGVRDVTTSFQYDGEGRVTQASGDAGTTTTTYDALGRVLSVKEPERSTVAASSTEFGGIQYDLNNASYVKAAPYTSMAYDAFGNLVRTRRYANGVESGQSGPVADDARDQIEVTLHDHQGRAVMTRDSYGKAVYSNYDAADNLTFRWYDLTGSTQNARIETRFTYDGLGRLVWQEQRRGATIEMSETLGHNAFGEVVTKQQGGLAGTLTYVYDVAGRLVSNNEGGATQQFGYNLAGHQVRHSRIAYLDSGSNVEAVTWNTTDRLGRAVQQRLPGYNDTGTTPMVLQQWDRWGNVLQIVDVRGYQTNYQYNDFNQIVRDERPLVEVMNSANQVVWQRPVNQWFYDAWGRLVATRDANGNLRSNEYDAAGRLVKVTDALGNSTRYAYDALGNERFAQNALGYLTFKQYDRMGRLTTIGDYLLNASGTQRDRAVLQSYLLNENGDRIRVTDALNNSVQYDYDGSNRLIRSQTAMGVVTQYGYDVQGHKTREDNALSLNGSLTVADPETGTAKVNQLSWAYDIYGRLVDHNNLSGRDSDYAYDAASGQLTVESSSGGYAITSGNGQKITKYFANGRIREVTEYNGSVDKNAGANVYRYEYDAAGNAVREEVSTFDGDGQAVHTVTRTQYDSNGRIARVIQDDVTTGKTVFDLSYSYDAVGNRRRVQTRTSYGPNTDTFTADNQAPVTAQPVTDRTVRKGMTSEFRVRVSDVFRDAEQDALSVQVTRSDGSALPSWLVVRFDATTGELVFTASPDAGAADEDVSVKLVAVENFSGKTAPPVHFTVRARVNSAPQLVDANPLLLNAKSGNPWGQELAAGTYFSDQDVGDSLTLAIDNDPASLPSWLTVDLTNRSVLRLSGTPPQGLTQVVTLYVRAKDQKGASVVKTVTINVAPNAAPNVVGSPSGGEAILNRPYVWLQPLSALFSDPNADTMRVTASGLPSWMTFTYLSDQANPQLRLDGQVPSTEQDGNVYPITFTATDTDGAASTVTINVTVRANRAPTINYPGGWSLPSIRIGDMLDTSVAIATLFGDIEGDAVSPSWINVPSWMTVTVDQAAGLIRFKGKPTSNASHAGDISFQIRGTDIGGLSSLATVKIHVGTDYAPVRTSVPVDDRVLSIGRPFSYTLPADMFIDQDGDGITYSAFGAYEYSWVEDTIPPTPMTEVYQQALPSWMSFDPATRTLSGTVPSGTPASSFVVRIQARDSRGNYSGWTNRIGAANVAGDYDITFKVQPFVNSVPIYNAGSLPARELNHGSYVDFAMPAGAFVEPDGDAMTYRAMVREPGYWDWVNTSSDPMEPLYEQVWREGNWVDISTIGLSIDANTGRITGTPTNLREKSFQATIVARDPQGAVNAGYFTFNVLNAAPIAPDIPNQATQAGVAWSYVIPAFSDVDGNALTYVVSGMPGWMTFDPSTRRLSGVPAPVGTWTLTVAVTDSAGVTTNKTFTVSTPNKWPSVINPLQPQWAWRNTDWSYQIPANTFADLNGDSLSYSVSGLPSGLAFDAASRTIYGRSGSLGSSTVTVTANDGRGGSASSSFVLTLTNAAPVQDIGLPARTGTQGQAVSWTMPPGAFRDPNNDGLSYSLQIERPAYEEWFWDASDNAWAFRQIPAQWITVAGLTIDPATGTISGTLPAFYQPVHPVTGQGGYLQDDYRAKIIASDGNATAEGVFNVHYNVAPSAITLGNATVKSGLYSSFQFAAFQDLNGDALSYTVWGLPAGMGVDSGTRTIYGTAQTAGSYTVYVQASDGQGGITTGSFTLTVAANSAPTAPGFGTQYTQVGTAFGITVPAFSDANYDALTYSIAGLPPGLWFDSNSRVIGGTPSAAGDYGVTVYANDGRGGVTGMYFVISVSPAPIPNRAPYVNRQPASPQYQFYATNRWPTPLEGFILPVDTFVDPDNNPLSYACIEKPAWLTYTWTPGSGHSFTGRNGDTTPWNNHYITIRATDTSGAWVDVRFYVASRYEYVKPGGPVEQSIPLDVQVLSFDVGAAAAPDMALAMDGSAGAVVQTMAATGTIPVEVKDFWYTYDAENRVVVNNGKLVNGQLQLDTYDVDSYSLAYDVVGNVVSRTSMRSASTYWVDRSAYDLRGNKVIEYETDVFVNGALTRQGGIEKTLQYDAAGRMTASLTYYSAGSYWDHTSPPGDYYEFYDRYYYGGWLYSAENYDYDADGRVTAQTNRRRLQSDMSWLINADNSGGKQSWDIGVLGLDNQTAYTGYDTAGRLTTYAFTNWDGGYYKHNYTTSYEGWESYQQKSVSGTAEGNLYYQPTTNTLTYDAMGRLMSQRERTQLRSGSIDDRQRLYSYTNDGKVLTRREGTVNAQGAFQQDATWGRGNYMFVHAAGQQIAELKEAFQLTRNDGSQYYALQLQNLGGGGVYSAGGGKVTAQAGDTLRSIAQRIYGTDQLWYVLAEANGFGDPGQEVAAGTLLDAPDVSVNTNDANTFKPYNPAEAIGNTTPSLPYIQPPPKESCNAVAMVLMVVVAVVVTYFTAGAAAGYFGTMFAGGATAVAGSAAAIGGAFVGGFVGGVVGSVASQAVGSAMGATSFSWKQVASDGITNAITMGAGEALTGVNAFTKGAKVLEDGTKTLNTLGRVTQGVVAYGGSMVASVAVNRDTNFSWNAVAASVAGSYVSAKTGGRLPLTEGGSSSGKFVNDLGGLLMNGAANSTARRMMGLGKQNWGQIAADAFGNALASAAVGSIQREQANRAEERAAVRSALPSLLEQDALPRWLQGTEPAHNSLAADALAIADNEPVTIEALPAEPRNYRVQKGDSLSSILGTSDPVRIGEVMALNGLSSSTIYPGQEIALGGEGRYTGAATQALGRIGQDALATDNSRLAAYAEARRTQVLEGSAYSGLTGRDLDDALSGSQQTNVAVFGPLAAKVNPGSSGNGGRAVESYMEGSDLVSVGMSLTSAKLDLVAKLTEAPLYLRYAGGAGVYSTASYLSTTADVVGYAQYGTFNLSYGKPLDGGGTLMFDMSRYSAKLASGSRWLGRAGIAFEAGTLVMKGDSSTGDDFAHLLVNTGMTYVSERGGVWGALAGAIWTVSDTYAQAQRYKPEFDGSAFFSAYKAGGDVQGWSVYRAMRNDNDTWGGMRLMKEHPEYKLQLPEAVEMYRTKEMIRRYERIHD